MNKIILKYEVPISNIFQLEMSKIAEILTVQNQRGQLCIWAKQPVSDQVMVTRTFMIIGTGHEFDDGNTKYLGTVQVDVFVWHIFECFGS
jgi:hypothetical protein